MHYAGALKTITDKLQRVPNAAVRVVSDGSSITVWRHSSTMSFIG